MRCYTFCASKSDGSLLIFRNAGRDQNGEKFTLDGECPDINEESPTVTFTERSKNGVVRLFDGRLDASTGVLSGAWHIEDTEHESSRKFHLKRLGASTVQRRSALLEVEDNKARWRIACDAILIQRRKFSWTYFCARAETRKRLIYLRMRLQCGDDTVKADIERIERFLEPQDRIFYQSLLNEAWNLSPDHEYVLMLDTSMTLTSIHIAEFNAIPAICIQSEVFVSSALTAGQENAGM